MCEEVIYESSPYSEIMNVSGYSNCGEYRESRVRKVTRKGKMVQNVHFLMSKVQTCSLFSIFIYTQKRLGRRVGVDLKHVRVSLCTIQLLRGENSGQLL